MTTRLAIQVISYNRSSYLEKTLNSLINKMGPKDKLCVIEQSDDIIEKEKCVHICKRFKEVNLIDVYKNLGQRGATNVSYFTGFFDNSQYVMLSDHDNIFHEDLDIYIEKLKQDSSIWCTTGYNSIEHDIERKDWDWLIKSTCRAGHMVFRANDFLSMMPLNTSYDAGTNCAWYAGLDWHLTYWSDKTPGYKRQRGFIACFPGGVEHIGSDSTWQGTYTKDDVSQEESVWFQDASFEEIIAKYPPQHRYIGADPKVDNVDSYCFNILGISIFISDIKGSISAEIVAQEMNKDVYNILNIDFEKDDVVLDFGANVGIFSITLAKLHPEINIYAFEPVKANYDNLLLNLAANQIKNVTAFNYAITHNNRLLKTITSKTMSGGAHIVEFDLINDVSETPNFIIQPCESINFKYIFNSVSNKIKNKIKLLKIDIEGSEYEIIQKDWIYLNYIEYLSGEFHFKGGEGLKSLCQEFFKPSNLSISCIAQDIEKPKDLKSILTTITGGQIDISKDLEMLTKK